MTKLKWFLGIGLLMVFLASSAQESSLPGTTVPMKFSLKQAQDYAMANNPSVKNALIDLESAKKKIWETTAIGLPQVTANGNYQYLVKIPEFSLGSYLNYSALPDGYLTRNDLTSNLFPVTVKMGVKQNFSWNVTASQLIFSGEYIVGLQASRVFKDLSDQNVAKTENDTKESVSNSYYIVLVGEENLAILRKSLDLINKTLNDVTAMQQQGFMQETDVDQIQINKMNIENMVSSVNEQTQLAYRLLKYQMGLDISQPVQLTDSLSSLIAQGNFNLWSQGDFDVQKNIEYKIMQTNESLSLLSLKREKSKFLPSLSGFYQHQALFKKPQFDFTIPDIIGVGISFPIFSSGSRISKVQQATLALEKTTISRNQVQQGLLISYEQSKSSYNKALNDYLTLKKSLALSDKIYRETLLKYKEGMASSLELTQAQNQFLTTEANYYSAVLSLFNIQTRLAKLLATE